MLRLGEKFLFAELTERLGTLEEERARADMEQ